MNDAAHFAVQMLDPRGRCNRKALLIWAGAMLGVQLLLIAAFMFGDVSPDHTAVKIANLAFLWLAVAATSKRLHDIGLSATWMIAGFAVWIAACALIGLAAMLTFGVELLDEGTPGYVALVAVFSAPMLYALVWLHAKPGDAHENRFGSVPTGLGLSMPAPAASAMASEAV